MDSGFLERATHPDYRQNMMNSWKDFFQFSKSEQYAIIVLTGLLLLTLLFIFIHPYFIVQKNYALVISDSTFRLSKLESGMKGYSNEKISTTEEKIDQLRPETTIAELKLKPFVFNPNQLPEEDWKKIGLTEKQIKTIKNYESKGGKFYKKEDLAKIYGISKEEYTVLEPFINIPSPDTTDAPKTDRNKQRFAEKEQTGSKAMPGQAIDLNSADSVDLVAIPGLGPWTAHRILKYRASLGGFSSTSQLLEIQGVDSTRFDQISQFIKPVNAVVKQLKINRLSFKELLKHPYLKYEYVKQIVKFRESKGFIKDSKALQEVSGMHDSELQKLLPYLDFD